jgi:hypothetical protein
LIKYLLISILLSCCLSSTAQDTTLVAIGNQTGVPSDIKMSELKAVFRGERQRWGDGTKVIIAMIKSTTPLGNVVSEKIYSKTGDEVRGFWSAISFAGKFDPPSVFNTSAEVEAFVSQNPGAIAILNKPISTTDIKTIIVSGKKTF